MLACHLSPADTLRWRPLPLQPRFISKKEREAMALQKRENEVAIQRAQAALAGGGGGGGGGRQDHSRAAEMERRRREDEQRRADEKRREDDRKKCAACCCTCAVSPAVMARACGICQCLVSWAPATGLTAVV